jgi:hypothetical protein
MRSPKEIPMIQSSSRPNRWLAVLAVAGVVLVIPAAHAQPTKGRDASRPGESPTTRDHPKPAGKSKPVVRDHRNPPVRGSSDAPGGVTVSGGKPRPKKTESKPGDPGRKLCHPWTGICIPCDPLC